MGYASGLATIPGFALNPNIDYWIPIGVTLAGYDSTTTAVQALLQVPDVGLNYQNWIVYSNPFIGVDSAQYIHLSFASPVTDPGVTVSWNVISLNNTIGTALDVSP